MYTYLKDQAATKVFTECRNYVIEFLSLLLELDKKYISENIELVDIRIGDNKEVKNSITDVLYKTPKDIYNIEINYNKYSGLELKNMTYLCHLVLRQNYKGMQYTKLKPVTQINLNGYDSFGKNEFVYISKLYESKYHLLKSNLIQIVDINLNYLVGKEYDKLNERLEKLLYIFVCGSIDKVKEISKDDSVMKEVSERLKLFEEEFDTILFYNREELLNQCAYDEGLQRGKEEGIIQGIIEGKKEGKKEGLKEGLTKGLNQGAQKEKIKIVQKMLMLSIDEERISEITGLSLRQIEDMKKKCNE